MEKLRTLELGTHEGREFFATVFVDPDPDGSDDFDAADADECGISVHFRPPKPFESHVEVARIDTEHGEPHFDRLYEPGQPNEWLGDDYAFERARRDLFTNWRRYAAEYLDTHGTEK